MNKREKFDLYYDLLIKWNQKFNLTAVTEREQVDILHFKDSVLCADLIKENAEVLDVGSGAGFPGIPLKIMRDDLKVTLIDSVNKKVLFLNEIINKLELKGIEAIHTRIEDLKDRKFDVVTSRAVALLNVLSEYCLPFVKTGGTMIAYKAFGIDRELVEAEKAIRILGGDKPEIITKELTGDIKRSFVVIKKITESPNGYPRGRNKPRTKPII